MYHVYDKYFDKSPRDFKDDNIEGMMAYGLVPDMAKAERLEVKEKLETLKNTGSVDYINIVGKEVFNDTKYEHRGFVYEYISET